MTVFTVCGMALLLATSAFVLREFGWRGTPVFAVLGGVCLLTFCIENLTRVSHLLGEISSLADIGESVGAVLKILCVGYLSSMTGDICHDLGADSVARALAVFARLEILALTLPFIERILAHAVSLVS